ncbi:unnamed protein product [Durusdinium trenchii]|uniref:Glycosyl transferase family 25 domain-containing protein n=1 Tax=Durusdinium trenchii TaxID=1381693 RepID=A0ABP0MB36_9DINO
MLVVNRVPGSFVPRRVRCLSTTELTAMASLDGFQGHFDMLYDHERNEAYAEAIRRAVERKTSSERWTPLTAVDIGSGAGLLGLLCWQTGRCSRVVLIEACPPLASVARENLQRNGAESCCRVWEGHSNDLLHSSATSQVEPFDLCVSELLDSVLIGEGVLDSLRKAWASPYLAPGKTMLIPERARVMGRLFRSDAIYRRHRGCEDLPEEMKSCPGLHAAEHLHLWPFLHAGSVAQRCTASAERLVRSLTNHRAPHARASIALLGLGSALFARYRPRYLQGLNRSRAGSRTRSAATRVAESVETLATAEIGWKSLAHVYCMNLDHRKERWDFMQRQFLQLKMPVERFSAVNGRELDVPELAMNGVIAMEALPRYYLPDEQKLFGTDLTAGAIGCALSHMLIWRDIVRRCAEDGIDPRAPFLVIEDDCQFAPDFSEQLLLERLSHVPEDWEIVYLGGQDLLRRQHLYEVGKGVRRLYKGFRETTAYLINDAGAKACLEVSVPLYWQIDTHMNDESLREGLKPPLPGHQDQTMHPRGYFLWPGICAQQREGFPTDVQKMEHD